MAIRVGVTGLKYQIPSYAELGARRSAAAASAGGSASASAYGANRRYAMGKKQLQHSAEQAFYEREHEMGAQLAAQQHDADMQRTALGHRGAAQLSAQAHDAGMAHLDFNLEQEGLDREYEMAQETMDAANALRTAGGDVIKLHGTPAQQEYLRQQIEQQQGRIYTEEEAMRYRGQTKRFPDGTWRRIPDDFGM